VSARFTATFLAALSAAPVTPAPAGLPLPTYDPARLLRVGQTYARARCDLHGGFTAAATEVSPNRDERRRLGFRFSNALDDAVRERIIETLASDGAGSVADLQRRFANDAYLDQATMGIRVLGLHETDLADVTSALVIAAYNVTHVVALTARQGIGLSHTMRAAVLASPLPTYDDATKQTIATEMSYQILLWASDATVYGYGRDPLKLGRLRASAIASLATLGIPLARLRPTDDGVELVP
jgi:hypothetical protein